MLLSVGSLLFCPFRRRFRPFIITHEPPSTEHGLWDLGVLNTRDQPTLVLQPVAVAVALARLQLHGFETRLESTGHLPARLLEDVVGSTWDSVVPVYMLVPHVMTFDIDDVFTAGSGSITVEVRCRKLGHLCVASHWIVLGSFDAYLLQLVVQVVPRSRHSNGVCV